MMKRPPLLPGGIPAPARSWTFLAVVAALALAGPLRAGTFSSSTTAPAVQSTDIANLATQTGSDKWFFQTADEADPSDAAKGQTFTTGTSTVQLKALTYKISAGNMKAAPTTYTVRVGTVSGATFALVDSETFSQTVNTATGAYMTWTFASPVTLAPNTTYGIDVAMDSGVSWQTGIPYLSYTANISNARIGTYYDSGDMGVGNSTLAFTSARDRVFHLDLEDPMRPSPANGATVPAGNVNLSWTNFPANTGTNVWVDVWFGTNATALTKVVSAALNQTSHTVSAPTGATYYWRIDSYLNGTATGTPVTGTRFSFIVTDTDGDGLPDAFELAHTTPASATALNPGDDLDSDGLTNMQEYQRGTLPRDSDTDYPGKIKPNAPFLVVTCGFDGWAAAGNRLTLVNAQLAVGNPALYPEFGGNVKSMEARGYWRTSGPSDQNYHYYHNAETYMLVGDAMGRGMMDLRYAGGDFATWAAQWPSYNLNDPEGDFDLDGVSNDDERVWGLNPTSGVSVSPIKSTASLKSGTFTYIRRPPSLSGRTYAVWTSPNLTTWTEDTGAIQAPAAPVGGVETVTVTLSPALLTNPKLFIRLEAAP